MKEYDDFMDTIRIVFFFLLISQAIKLFALFNLIKRRKTKTLSRLVWAFIIIVIEFIGALAYFAYERPQEK
ncbi:MAG: PLDc N-terminal domain-containing protein [Patescibacteria group bacterium]